MKGCNQGWMCLNWWRRNWFYTLQGGNIQWAGEAMTNGRKEPRQAPPDNRGSQSDLPLFTMAHKNNGWCPGTPDGNHFFQNYYLMVYIFVHPGVLSKTSSFVSKFPELFWFVVIFLVWLIRPVPPSLHTSLFALVNAGPRFPPLPRIPQFTKCLPISTSSNPHCTMGNQVGPARTSLLELK